MFSVDFLNINIRIKLYDLKREYQIKITYFLQKKKKKEPDLYRNFIFNYYFPFDIHKILYREGIKKKKKQFTILFVLHVSSLKSTKKKRKEFLIKIGLTIKLEGKEFCDKQNFLRVT